MDHVLEEMRRFGSHPTLHDVRGLARVRGGTLWVLSGSEPFLHRYSADGRLTGSWGKKGRGPGELLNPWSIMGAEPEGPAVRVWDPALRRLTAFSSSGEPADAGRVSTRGGAVRGDIRQVSYGEPQKMDRLGDAIVIQDDAGGISQTSDFWNSRLLLLDQTGSVVDTVLDFRELLTGQPLGPASVFVPVPLWTTCSGERLLVLDPLRNRVRVFARNGKPVSEQAFASDVRRVSEDDIRRYVRHTAELEFRGENVPVGEMERLVNQIVSQRRGLFATQVPPAVALLCDEAGRPWLNRFSTADGPIGYGPDWLVLDGTEDGQLVRFPPRFRPLSVGAGGAYGVHEDSLGVQSVAFVPFPRPGFPEGQR